MSTERAQWKSRFGFILAAAGSAIGLGNIWKFPYITGENGGGLFVLIYLACIALVGIPIMMAEIMIGRAAQKQPVGAFETLQGKKTPWGGIGWMGVAAGFIILSYYAVVAGWAMDFTLKSVVNFTSSIETSAAGEAEAFVMNADISDLREMLVKDAVQDALVPFATAQRRTIRPSEWSAYATRQQSLYEAEQLWLLQLATDDADVMRGALVELELNHQMTPYEAEQIATLNPGVWREYQWYNDALDAVVQGVQIDGLLFESRTELEDFLAETVEAERTDAESRLLMGNDALREKVEAAKVVQAQIDQRREELKAELTEQFAAMSDQEVINALRSRISLQHRMTLDEETRESIDAGQAVQDRIDAEETRLTAEHTAAVAEMSDADVIAETETLKRRELVFDQTQAAFLSTATDGWTSMLWTVLFMLITIMIVAAGISGGIERACGILMPTLFVMIVGMVIYGAFQPGFGRALDFVFRPDPSKLKASGVLEALGHAFFTLSLGMGAMITYGSYQSKKEGLLSESVMIAVLDTTVALLACLMIFPITFSYGQEPGAGPGLVFMSMPLAFAEIGAGGMLLGIIFFGLLVFAALTSAISLLEVVASYFIDQKGWSRMKAAWIMGLVILAFGIPSAFSMHPTFAMTGWEPGFGMNFFDTMDYLASNWMLPIGGLMISIYAGWVMPRRLQEAEVQDMPPLFFQGWLLLVRFVAPALVLVVIAQKVGILDADELFFTLFKK